MTTDNECPLPVFIIRPRDFDKVYCLKGITVLIRIE